MNLDSSVRDILLNSSFLLLGSFFAKGASFIFNILVSRNFGAEGLGIFSLGTMVVSFGATISLLGFQDGLVNYVGRYDSADRKEELVGTVLVSFSISIVLSLLVAGILVIGADLLAIALFSEPELSVLIPIFAVAIPAMVVVKLSGAAIHGVNRSQFKVLIQQLVPKGGLLIGTLLAITVSADISMLAIIYTGSLVGGAAVGLLLTGLLVMDRYEGGVKTQPMNLLGFSIPLLFSGFVGMIFRWTDTFFVGYFLQTTDVGQYQAAYLLGSNVPIFLAAMAGGLYPNIAGYVSDGRDKEVTKRYHQTHRWSVLLTFAPAVYLVVFRSAVLESLFGPEFGAAGLALVAVVVGNTLGVIIGPATVTIKAIEQSRYILVTNVLALVFNVAVNVLLIPVVGILGAALSTMIATVLTNSLHYWRARQRFSLQFNLRLISLVLVLAGLVGGILRLVAPVPNSIPYLILHIMGYSMLYIGTVYWLGLVKPEKLRKFRDALV